jgi:hypothetical protein
MFLPHHGKQAVIESPLFEPGFFHRLYPDKLLYLTATSCELYEKDPVYLVDQ